MSRHDLSDQHWEIIAPLLPAQVGRKRRHDRRTINGILYVLKTGCAFRTRSGLPSVLEKDDVRRITTNWIEYHGIVVGKRAKDHPGYSLNPDEIPLDEKRAVFDVALLRRVGQVRAERSFKRTDAGRNVIARTYPLAGLVYCAYCDRVVEKNNNPTLRSRLIGKAKNDDHKGSYRHRPG